MNKKAPSQKNLKRDEYSALPPNFCNKITALNVLTYAFLLTEDSGETYWLEISMSSNVQSAS